MIVRLFAYPTDSNGRVPLWDAQRVAGTPGEGDGWQEYVPSPPDRSDLDMLALGLKWASEGQAVRIEIS